jgi:serine/threonine protein kinase
MNYTIKSKLGEGGMSTVHLAEDPKFQADVAIKILNKEFIHNEHIRKRFISEARSMFRMSHPHVIKVTDLIDEGDTVAFVMEYVEGETLKDFLERKGRLTDEEIKEIFSQMLDAVGYVHEQKLVHRDIKPSNFMLDKSGRVKLMDFGIAKNTDVDAAEYTQTGTGMQMGTPMYMSPEQITETKSVTPQSDIYSLGVVLWQMVTGKKPYDTKTMSSFQLQTKIVSENLAETNTLWDKTIQKATSKDGQDRYKSCQELKQDLASPAVEKEDVDELTQIDDLKTQVVIDDLKTQVVTQEEKIVKREESSEEVNAIPLKKFYFQLIAPVLILLSELYLRFFWTENWFSFYYTTYSMSILLVVIIVSIILLQRFKSSLSKSAFIFWMGFYVLNSIFVIGAHLYNIFTDGISTYGNFLPYEYYTIWNFIYIPYDVLLAYSLIDILIGIILIVKKKNSIINS